MGLGGQQGAKKYEDYQRLHATDQRDKKCLSGKRLESEILTGLKRKGPETKGLFLSKMVEAAGIEPASENLSAEHLHT